MPRSHPIARLTIDRPQGRDQNSIAKWLEYRAEELVSEPNCYSLTGFRARRFNEYDTKAEAVFRLRAAGCLSLETRKRIAKWLRSRAAWVRKHGQFHDRRWFTQEFSL